MADLNWNQYNNGRSALQEIAQGAVNLNALQQQNQQLQARPEINKQIQAGNLDAANKAALGTGDFDYVNAISQLTTQQRAQTQQKLKAASSVAYGLIKVKDPAQRAAIYERAKAGLKGVGWTDDDLDHVDLDDDSLNLLISEGQSIDDLLKNDAADRKFNYEVQQDALKRQDGLNKPITAADGAVLTRNEDGSFTPIYTPGTKAQDHWYTDADGNQHMVNIPGTPGQSYSRGNGITTNAGSDYDADVEFFTSKGYPEHVAKGIVNNLHYESGGGRLDARGDGGQAYGLAQWHPDRQNRFRQVMGVDIRQATRPQQLAFVDWELKNTEAGAGKALMNARDSNEATGIFMSKYERPANMSSLNARMGLGRGGNNPQPQGQSTVQNNGIRDTNLGGGRSGPEWVDAEQAGMKGQRSTKTGKFEAYPSQGGGKTKGTQDYAGDIRTINDTLALTEKLYQHPGLSDVVGVPSLTGGLLAGKIIPGTNAANFKALMENFDAKAYLSQVTQLKGMGALSDAEGRKLSAAIGALSTSQSESAFKENLNVVRRGLIAARGNLIAKQRASQTQGGQAPRQAQSGQPTAFARNPQTGERLGLINGKWVKM